LFQKPEIMEQLASKNGGQYYWNIEILKIDYPIPHRFK